MISGTAFSILLFAIAITIGLLLAKLNIKGITIGSTWILFIGILMGHFGLIPDPKVLSFMKDFGLILFVYSIGLQVGPGFFSSFKNGGVKLNMLAVGCFSRNPCRRLSALPQRLSARRSRGICADVPPLSESLQHRRCHRPIPGCPARQSRRDSRSRSR